AASTPHKGLEHPDIHRADVIFVDLSAEDELVPFLTHFEHDEGSERRPKIFGLSNADPTLALRAHPRLDGRIRKPAQLPEVVAALRRALWVEGTARLRSELAGVDLSLETALEAASARLGLREVSLDARPLDLELGKPLTLALDHLGLRSTKL